VIASDNWDLIEILIYNPELKPSGVIARQKRRNFNWQNPRLNTRQLGRDTACNNKLNPDKE
jgi:hypothetical protein